MDCRSCMCCRPCRPRYQRLVDNIYPANPNDGLISNNMQKLTFYAISHPEKLDRIGNYLVRKLIRDVYRERTAAVKITIDAMNRLLTSCHNSPSLNQFVKAFLSMVQKLLETSDPQLQILATQSFVQFANIQEETPDYHRPWDFFIQRFAAMCHNNNSNQYLKRKIRIAGLKYYPPFLKGLRGVVLKTVSDDLQANIWEGQHMSKIVPSLLFNMHDDVELEDEVDAGNVEEVPKLLADAFFREVAGKASYSTLKYLLKPLLQHFDHHKLWSPPSFATDTHKAVMYSIQSQYSYVVIQMLMGHLDQHGGETDPRTRIGIATVLAEIVVIAANASPVGPSLLEIFNNLLRHLRSSVEFQHSDRCRSVSDEMKYQETLIDTMGEFAKNLPDYQKVEIMMFIIGKVDLKSNEQLSQSDQILRNVLVRTLLKVATKYRTTHMATVLTTSFATPLLKLALVDDAKVRRLVQRILHTLLDRHENASVLEMMQNVTSDLSDFSLNFDKCSRSDAMFMRKNAFLLLSSIYHSALSSNNTAENFSILLQTMELFCLELGNEETLVDLYRLGFALQAAAQEEIPESEPNGEGGDQPRRPITLHIQPDQRGFLHNLVAKYFDFSSQLIAIPSLCAHVRDVIKKRSTLVPCLNLLGPEPPEPATEDFMLDDALLFSKTPVAEALESAGYDVSKFETDFIPRPMAPQSGALKNADGESLTNEPSITSSMDSLGHYNSLVPPSRRGSVLVALNRSGTGAVVPDTADIPITVQALREIALKPIEKMRAEQSEHAKKVVEEFRTIPAQKLMDRYKEKSRDHVGNIQAILRRVKEKEALVAPVGVDILGDKPTNLLGACRRTPVKSAHDIKFPDLFVY